MKKVGFIDFYLDEWHAIYYPDWIKQSGKKYNFDIEVAYAWGEIDSPKGLSNAQWCKSKGITLLPSIEKVCCMSDYIIILCPDNAEKHLQYAEIAAKFKKPMFIDKTFAPDYDTAVKIFATAEKHGTTLYSTSSLRYSEELEEFNHDAKAVITTGKGPSYDTYAVHQLEMVIKLLGTQPQEVIAHGYGNAISLAYKFADEKRAVVNFGLKTNMPYSICAVKNNNESVYREIKSEFFPRFIDALVYYFKSGILPVSKSETLAVSACIDAGKRAIASPDTVIRI